MDKSNYKNQNEQKVEKGSESPFRSDEGGINTDPNGSWTGVVTDNPYETPVQDVDDL